MAYVAALWAWSTLWALHLNDLYPPALAADVAREGSGRRVCTTFSAHTRLHGNAQSRAPDAEGAERHATALACAR